MAVIESVSGPLDADQLGLVLAHEHLRASSETIRAQFPHLFDKREELRAAIEEVRRTQGHGVRTIVDPACVDIGRDARFAQQVVEETGIQLILCTGVYGVHYTYLPHHFQTRDVDYLADAFVYDIEQGIQEPRSRPHF